MFRKTLLVTGPAVVGIALWAGASHLGRGAGQAEPKTRKAASYVHTVIFHVKKDAPDDEVSTLIRDAHELLGKIPSVRELRVGRPAEKGTPDFAKKDFQVALLVLFDDFQGLETYLDHPQHQKFLDRHGSHVDLDKLQVYDFVDQRK
jgi:mRNA-degrading endonuclease YafQ of YafQ-DinJ toxin-antitoxin module